MLKLGVLGTANIAETMIQAAELSDKVQITAIAGRDKAKSLHYAERFNIPISYSNYDDLLNSKDVDAIYLPLVNSLHTEWVIKALKKGFNVLCEKPLATNAKDAESILKAARRTQLSVVEGFMYQHHPMYKEIAGIIASGEIGSLSTLSACFSWFCDDRSETPANFELGGGCLLDVGCYPVHFFRLVTGAEPLKAFAFEKRSNVDDTMMGTLVFPDNILAQFESSIANFERHKAEITGTKGSIVSNKPWVNTDSKSHITVYCEDKPERVIEFSPVNTYTLELDYFADIVNSNKPNFANIEDAINNMKVIDALFKSAKTGQAVEIE